MADDAAHLTTTGELGMADYRAARLRAQEGLVIELLGRRAGLDLDAASNAATESYPTADPGSEEGGARLRALETVICALLKGENDQDWLEALRRQTEALPLTPDWVGMWRVAQLQLLNQASPPQQSFTDEDDDDFFDE